MKRFIYFGAFLAAFVALSCVTATTVIPPTFNELVDEADTIFQGSVTSVRSEWVGEGAQRHIMTYVTFNVEQSIKGQVGKNYTLRMLGGTVDGETMGIADAPRFEVGNRDILFVQNNGSQVIPLVGIMHGRFRVARDGGGREVVTRNNGRPVRDIGQLGVSNASEQNAPALTPEQFKTAITERLRQTGHVTP